jgi:GNAT superfamily N-acetyltransferase
VANHIGPIYKSNMRNNNSFQIRQFESKYKEDVIGLILTIQKEFDVHLNRADQPDLEDVQKSYIEQNGNFFIALDNTKVIGTIAAVCIDDEKYVLRKMYVCKKYRGKEIGIAKLLLDKFLLWLQEKRVKEIYLGTNEKYKAAHRFYEKNGFFEIGMKDLPKSFPLKKAQDKFFKYILIK